MEKDIKEIKCDWYIKHILPIMMECHLNHKSKEKNND